MKVTAANVHNAYVVAAAFLPPVPPSGDSSVVLAAMGGRELNRFAEPFLNHGSNNVWTKKDRGCVVRKAGQPQRYRYKRNSGNRNDDAPERSRTVMPASNGTLPKPVHL